MNTPEAPRIKYTIKLSSRFKKHLKLVVKRNTDNARRIKDATDILQTGEALPERYRDHALTGNWAGHRECHILPDLLLILELVDTGSHSDLFSK
jgi:mRNA interferase YafQ